MNLLKAKSLYLVFIGIFASSCSSIRETQVEVASGNYDYAINRALEGLKRNQSNKKTDEYAVSSKRLSPERLTATCGPSKG